MNGYDKLEEKIGHSPHPAIVALPLGAWMVSAVSDIMGLATGQRAYDDTARISMGIGLVGAAGAVVTGLRDFGYIPKERPTHAIAIRHGTDMAIAASLLATSFILRKRGHEVEGGPTLAARLLALTGCGISLYSAWLGGKLVEEYGEAVKPVIRQQQQAEQSHKNARTQMTDAYLGEPREAATLQRKGIPT